MHLAKRLAAAAIVAGLSLAFTVWPGLARAEPLADLGGYVDGVVQEAMRAKGIAGVQVAVVDAGGTLYVRAYGDASRSTPRVDVDPTRTLFRVGSISKTFTYVAAMQLVEQGRLDLHADANRYLPPPLRIPDEGYGPVEVERLMTHTAGFEDSALPHLFHLGTGPVQALDDYLAQRRPRRVRPPGVHAVYSNYSVALLGAIVAQVSGEPFEAYVEEHLLSPLGMEHTTFREPLPGGDPRGVAAALEGDFSVAFKRDAGGFTAEPFEHLAQIAPAASASSTAADMARWMRMLLGGGVLDGRRVLAPETFRELATVTFRNAGEVGALAHGFFRLRYGRHESLEHAGDTLAFHSNLVVLPDAGLGVFVTANTDAGQELAGDLPRLVLERLRADARPDAVPPAPQDFATSARRFEGVYVSERRARSTFEKLPLAVAARTTVTVGDDGTLVVGAGGAAKRWAPDGGLVFRAVETGRRMTFFEDGAGRVTGFASSYGSEVSVRVDRLDDPMTVFLALGVLAAASVGVLRAAWRRRGDSVAATRVQRAAERAATFAAAVWVAFLAAFATSLSWLRDPFEAMRTYPSPLMRLAVALAYVGVALALASLVLSAAAWRRASWTPGRRARHGVFVAMMLAVALLLVEWNVLFAPYVLGG